MADADSTNGGVSGAKDVQNFRKIGSLEQVIHMMVGPAEGPNPCEELGDALVDEEGVGSGIFRDTRKACTISNTGLFGGVVQRERRISC